VGKTGWLRRTFPNELYFDLLEARTYSQLLADPTRLAERIPHDYSGWVILVEVQRIPELLNEVHRLMEHLLVSKALPVFRPHTTSAPLATYHFCMGSIVPVLRLTFEAFRLSLLAFESRNPR
jgi:hypothetical protein